MKHIKEFLDTVMKLRIIFKTLKVLEDSVDNTSSSFRFSGIDELSGDPYLVFTMEDNQ